MIEKLMEFLAERKGNGNGWDMRLNAEDVWPVIFSVHSTKHSSSFKKS